jgi:hypothetical protein
MSSPNPPTTAEPLPLVVQFGFAGARQLYDPKQHPDIDPAAFEKAVQAEFQSILTSAVQSLNLAPHLFPCGVSPVAVGGDTVFTRTCQALGWPQRVFLPQPREEFLNAVGSAGPDFTDDQKQTARQLLDGPHVVEERVVSDAADRRDRFHDVNLELAHICNVLVCLLPEAPAGKPGGTHEILDLGRKRNRPVLVVQIEVRANKPVLTSVWHNREEFKPPTLPPEIANATLPAGVKSAPLPDIEAYTRGLKDLASGSANWGRKHFAVFAFVIILAHVLATVCAVLALKLHTDVVMALLSAELLLLFVGFSAHQYLHRTRRLQRWAMPRLAAEVARSVSAVGGFHMHLRYLFTLPMPTSFRPLLETINVLHLRSTRASARQPWVGGGDKKRDAYVQRRLTDPKVKAQIPYNEETHRSAGRWLAIARWTFIGASTTAFLAAFLKLVCVCRWVEVDHELEEVLRGVLGFVAVVFPVVAVAALSLGSAFDLEARHTNSKEMLEFLPAQRELLKSASSAREYAQLLTETENRLLGETVGWYARRAFLGVS